MEDMLPIRLENIHPILSIKDMDRSRAFYVDILGFKEADWGTNEFTSISRDGSAIYLYRDAQGNPGAWVWVGFDGDIFELYRQLKSKGVVIRQTPTNHSWALEMQIEDPDGHILMFGTEPDNTKPFLD